MTVDNPPLPALGPSPSTWKVAGCNAVYTDP